jgi:hypothetical protein
MDGWAMEWQVEVLFMAVLDMDGETYTQRDILLREIEIEIQITTAVPSIQLSPPVDLRRRPKLSLPLSLSAVR